MWTPTLTDGNTPLFRRLADAIAADVVAGRLAPGDKLPPHRELAHHLSLAVGTVTRAYDEAERQGLIVAHVGRGSFVAERPTSPAPAQGGVIDLARNIAPAGPAAPHLAQAVAALRRRGDLMARMDYAPPLGHESDRRAGARWLQQAGRIKGADWSRVACTNGAQQAVHLVVSLLTPPGGTVLSEDLTYIGLKALAAHQGINLHGVAMDAEGLLPDALERAILETGARLLYTVPTLHNPTGRVMGPDRRAAIAKLARRHDLWIVEDDIYGHFVDDPMIVPLAELAPERSFVIGGLSKTCAPGLRAGYLLMPDQDWVQRVAAAIRAVSFAPAGLSFAVATELIESGGAMEIVHGIRAEITARTKLACDVLGDLLSPPAAAASLHLWLPMPALEAERVATRSLRNGAAVLTGAGMALSADSETGLRVSMGSAISRDDLTTGLNRLKFALSPQTDASTQLYL